MKNTRIWVSYRVRALIEKETNHSIHAQTMLSVLCSNFSIASLHCVTISLTICLYRSHHVIFFSSNSIFINFPLFITFLTFTYQKLIFKLRIYFAFNPSKNFANNTERKFICIKIKI
jgi:hypothetical protein